MKKTALNQTHIDQSGQMVEFAGYNMPVQYQDGMLKEHEWVRSGNVGLFDVSHMGQIILEGPGLEEFFSYITPSSFLNAKDNGAKYTVLTNEKGGIIDDLIITKINDNKFFVVINAGCKEKDIAWIESKLPQNVTLTRLDDRSLIAVQGQKAEEILQKQIDGDDLANLPYMNIGFYQLKNGADIFISRTGYTGEDGFEVSIKNDQAADFWLDLCKNEFVKPIGLGARDSLRLEMGYPLYGHDLDENTTPIEATLGWVVSKTNDKFIGSDIILEQKANQKNGGISKKRVGIKLLEKGIAREGCDIFNQDGQKIGTLTSGGFSPDLKVSIGQAYLDINYAKIDQEVLVAVRKKQLKAIVHSPTFVKAKTKSLK